MKVITLTAADTVKGDGESGKYHYHFTKKIGGYEFLLHYHERAWGELGEDMFPAYATSKRKESGSADHVKPGRIKSKL